MEEGSGSEAKLNFEIDRLKREIETIKRVYEEKLTTERSIAENARRQALET